MAGTRPKGYLRLANKRSSDPNEWSPTLEARHLIGQVLEIINASRFGAMSVRFIFYRLVGNYGYPKTERDYKNLAELLVKARRAQLIPFRAIADSGTEIAGGVSGWRSRKEFLSSYKSIADYFTLYELIDQKYEIELWAEDGGSIPMLSGIVADWPVTVYATGGFSSVTVTHEIAQRVLGRDRPTIFLHVGDYDPSGESIFKSMSQDIGAFVVGTHGGSWNSETGETFIHEDDDDGYDFRPVRVALTEEQTLRWNLETAPPKASDSRSVNWVGETVQVQAMSEDQMEETVLAAVRQYVDEDALEALRSRSEELREEMAPLLVEAFDNVIGQLEEED